MELYIPDIQPFGSCCMGTGLQWKGQVLGLSVGLCRNQTVQYVTGFQERLGMLQIFITS